MRYYGVKGYVLIVSSCDKRRLIRLVGWQGRLENWLHVQVILLVLLYTGSNKREWENVIA